MMRGKTLRSDIRVPAADALVESGSASLKRVPD